MPIIIINRLILIFFNSDLFDEEITDISDLDGRPYTTTYLSPEEKSELYELKELIKEKLKTVDIVQVIPRN